MKQKRFRPAILSTLVLLLTAHSIFAAKPSAKTNSPCADPHDGHHICMVFNYSERPVWASYEKTDWKDKSAEQRKARFPGRIPLDNGDKYSLLPASASFKPFSVIYKGNQGGCEFTFSPVEPRKKPSIEGYNITSKGVGGYSDGSCQVDGGSLIISENHAADE